MEVRLALFSSSSSPYGTGTGKDRLRRLPSPTFMVGLQRDGLLGRTERTGHLSPFRGDKQRPEGNPVRGCTPPPPSQSKVGLRSVTSLAGFAVQPWTAKPRRRGRSNGGRKGGSAGTGCETASPFFFFEL